MMNGGVVPSFHGKRTATEIAERVRPRADGKNLPKLDPNMGCFLVSWMFTNTGSQAAIFVKFCRTVN
jgi:hypothetical protein